MARKKTEDQFAALRAAVARAAAEFHAACRKKAPRESPYGLVLYTDNDMQMASFTARTEEDFQRQAARSPDTAERWDMAAWELRDYGRNAAQPVVSAIWAGVGEDAADRVLRETRFRVLDAFGAGLEEFVRSGAAAMNGQRGRLVTLIAVGDPDHDIRPRLDAWARRLNPDATDLWFHRTGGADES
jgi:Domain of unknown function (DUF4303)